MVFGFKLSSVATCWADWHSWNLFDWLAYLEVQKRQVFICFTCEWVLCQHVKCQGYGKKHLQALLNSSALIRWYKCNQYITYKALTLYLLLTKKYRDFWMLLRKYLIPNSVLLWQLLTNIAFACQFVTIDLQSWLLRVFVEWKDGSAHKASLKL